MPEELSRSITAFIQAKQDHDGTALRHTLNDEAILVDGKNEYDGIEQIEKWNDELDKASKITYEIGNVEEDANETVVAVEASGNFPESPTLLTFHFKLHNNKISRVLIAS